MQTRRCCRKPFFLAVGVFFLLFLMYWGVRAYVGDINYDNLIDQSDLEIITAAFGSTESSGAPNWNPAADLNEDDKVDVEDLAIAGRNVGSQHNFHQARLLDNSATGVFNLDACIDGQDRVHVAWSDTRYRNVYYTRLDRFGNTLIDDVLVDSGASTGTDIVAIGCDEAGNAHLIWDCVSDVCEARFDPWGYRIVPKTVVDGRWVSAAPDAAVDLDSQGRTHVFYRMGTTARMIYAMFTPEGEKAVSIEEPQIYDAITSRYRQLAVDDQDNVHLVWSEEDGVDRLYYAKLGADAAASIPAQVIGETHWDGGVNDAHKPSLAVDAQGDALILWNRSNPSQIFLEKIDPGGNTLLDDFPIFPEWVCCYHQDLAVDQDDQLHVWAPTRWGRGTGLALNAYGLFDNAAQVIRPMRWAMYGSNSYYPQLIIDSQGDAQLLFKPVNVYADDPACPVGQLCYQSTAFDAQAYDRSLPDLGVDVAHLAWSPVLVRWGQTLTLTATVFNAGWVASPATTATFGIALADDSLLPAPAQAEAAIAPLEPRQTQEVVLNLSLPTLPPQGYESLEYADLRAQVDPSSAVAENTESNNQVASPVMIQPLPTTAGLFMLVRDNTLTARGAGDVPLKTGTAHLTGPEIDRLIPINAYTTILANDLPIGTTDPITYHVTWQASGYREPAPFLVGIGRNPGDPYVVDFYPDNTALFETDTWGALSGTLSASDTLSPVVGATVRLQGQGITVQTTTDANGQFTASTEPKLGQLIPGEYAIYVSAPNYGRVSDSLTISALTGQSWDRTMSPTTKAYVRGGVINPFGRPVANAAVTACASSTQTASDGSFDLGEVEASCTALQVSKSGYEDFSQPIALTAGLEEYLEDITLAFDPPVDVVQDEGSLASWEQDESSADLLPDPPDDASWIETQLFDQFSAKFWPSYRVQVWWATFEYYVDGTYTGPSDDRHLYQVQLRLVPKSFEAHRVSGKGAMKLFGRTIKLEISRFEDSGMTTALWVVEARLVNGSTGEVIKTVRNPIEGGGSWIALADTTRTYDFEGVTVEDWDDAEVWIFIKVGKNESDEWTSSPILRGWYFDQQVLRFDLDDPGQTISDYVLVDFPSP